MITKLFLIKLISIYMNNLSKDIIDPCIIEIILKKGKANIKIKSILNENINEQDLLEIKANTKEYSDILLNLGIK